MTLVRPAQMVYVNITAGTSAWIVSLMFHPFYTGWGLLSLTGVYLLQLSLLRILVGKNRATGFGLLLICLQSSLERLV